MSDLNRFREEWRQEVQERISHNTDKTNTKVNTHYSSTLGSHNTLPTVLHSDDVFKAERPRDIYINHSLSELDLLALDDFEKAVDREHVGKLGDAVKYYREAFRKNEQVDKLFREKYYSKKTLIQTCTGSSAALDHLSRDVAVLSVGNDVSDKQEKLQAEDENEQEEENSLIMELPLEVLEHILICLALDDFKSFVTSAYTCKKFWQLFQKSQAIWKSVCLKEYSNQHYLPEVIEEEFKGAVTQCLIVESLYDSNWQNMYSKRARVRFNGVYISTCNYMRSGMGETWSTPIHMVTYYRYCRFYRDGTCISLLTVAEPADVVPVFLRQTMDGSHPVVHIKNDGTLLTRPKDILYGTWQLTSNDGDLLIQSEGSVDRYTFYLHLQIRSSGKNHHNKLKWKRYWSFNKLSLSEGVS